MLAKWRSLTNSIDENNQDQSQQIIQEWNELEKTIKQLKKEIKQLKKLNNEKDEQISELQSRSNTNTSVDSVERYIGTDEIIQNDQPTNE